MNNKIVLGAVAVAVVIAGAAFWVGISYGKSAAPARGQFGGAGGTFARPGGMMGGRSGTGGGFTAGQILSKDASSITVKMQNGNTAIVLIGSSTEVVKSVTGSAADLSVGENVVVTGTQNSDGSVTAQSVQIRPAGSPAVRSGTSQTQ